jgi:GNAT superfamily N-acetyltransferase
MTISFVMLPRLARRTDIPALNALIESSARALSVGFYTPEQVEALVQHVFGVDTQLIDDGTYYVIDAPDGSPAAAGGWSARRTLYGGDQHKSVEDPRLDPVAEPARIRAFFVHPDWARRGFGRLLYETCAAAASAAEFHSLELMATLPGIPLYVALGFERLEPVEIMLPDDIPVPLVRMGRSLRG